MKKTAYYYLSLAAIVAGGLVSCQDDDRGFTSEEVKASVYEREFIKAFGQPASSHLWGWDQEPFFMADLDYINRNTINTRATYVDSDESHVKKYDMIWANSMHVKQCLDLPEIISEREHTEVYNWFSNHKVYWKNTPTDCDDPNSRVCTDADGTVLDGVGIAYEIESNFDYGTLSSDYYGDQPIKTEFIVNWAWVQYVANDAKRDEVYYDTNQSKDVVSDADGSKMNLLAFRNKNSETYIHLLDFNNGTGKGYGVNDKTSNENAILVYNTDFNSCIFNSSVDGSHQFNKYIIIYLKGEGYEGYYLGMDIEGNGSNSNERVKANGICNDWIIKLTVPMAKIVQGEPRRIMCEDLGGVYDYDFNDIVIDVTPSVSKHDKGQSGHNDVPYLEVKLQALGGTLPIYVTYDGQALWGAAEQDLHELFSKRAGYPVNVTNGVDNSHNGAYTAEPLVARVVKTSDKRNNYQGYTVDLTGAIETDSDIDYKKIHIYIKPSSEAEWIQLANYAGIAPLKIIVPQTVGWTIECAGMPGTETSPKSTEAYESLSSGRSMGCAYPDFMGWVNDPSALFWDRTIVTDYIVRQ